MQVSLFTIVMTIIWSSVLIIVFYILRKKLMVFEACSITGIIAIYLFCAVRMLLPVELPWTKVVSGGIVWNSLHTITSATINLSDSISFNIGQALLLIWIVGFLYKIAKIGINYFHLFKDIAAISKEIVNNPICEASRIQVFKSEQMRFPFAAGILDRVIILPNRKYTEKQERYILLHEISHHKNKDIIVKLFINILCAIYWWNPFVYLLKKDINQSLEIRCDQAVVKSLDKNERAEYLSVILEEFKNSIGILSSPNEYIMELFGHKEAALVERFGLVANGNYSSKTWKKILVIVSFTIILIGSYSVVIQSSFDAPELEEGTYYYDETNSYILLHKDGTYSLITPYDAIEIDPDTVDFYVDSGFFVKEE